MRTIDKSLGSFEEYLKYLEERIESGNKAILSEYKDNPDNSQTFKGKNFSPYELSDPINVEKRIRLEPWVRESREFYSLRSKLKAFKEHLEFFSSFDAQAFEKERVKKIHDWKMERLEKNKDHHRFEEIRKESLCPCGICLDY